jgi:hypothetical protein
MSGDEDRQEDDDEKTSAHAVDISSRSVGDANEVRTRIIAIALTRRALVTLGD